MQRVKVNFNLNSHSYSKKILKSELISKHIEAWLKEYVLQARLSGFIIGVSGGIDSAVTSILCANTGMKTILLNMPIRQTNAEYNRAQEHIEDLKSRYPNVSALEINLTQTFESFEAIMPFDLEKNHLAMANSRARLRMTTIYAVAQANDCLVVGTGNKIEDFGIGFFTKYGDGGVDISPIADLMKTEVWKLAKHLNVIESIQVAKPTDGLFEDGRSDEDQIGATYSELEWAMTFNGDVTQLTVHQKDILSIFTKLNRINKHKINPIPVCCIPKDYLH